MSTIPLGQKGEQIAANYLKQQGFKVLTTNFRTRYGELDIVAKKDNTIHFVEVKTLQSPAKLSPYESVRGRKVAHLKKAISIYLLQNGLRESKLSLDVASIILTPSGAVENIRYIENIE